MSTIDYLKRSSYYYDLPEELIAHYPLAERTQSRLLVLDRNTGTITHHHFYELPYLLLAGDLLVFNNSRVIPARLFAHRHSGGKIEILIERILTPQTALAHIRSGKSLKANEKIVLAEAIETEIIEKKHHLYHIQLLANPLADDWFSLLEKIGHIPIPPYFKREAEKIDKERYQTVYAKYNGSVAAPTAGLHFDDDLLTQLKEKNIERSDVTLHVGAGTFQSMRVENIQEHQMHYEYIDVPSITCEKINLTKKNNGRVIAVGTTSARSLETAAQNGNILPYQGETNLFIYPGIPFNCIDGLITNFHLPESTLLMMICAFAGYEFAMRTYEQAIQYRYRFFSYGDAMLIF